MNRQSRRNLMSRREWSDELCGPRRARRQWLNERSLAIKHRVPMLSMDDLIAMASSVFRDDAEARRVAYVLHPIAIDFLKKMDHEILYGRDDDIKNPVGILGSEYELGD